MLKGRTRRAYRSRGWDANHLRVRERESKAQRKRVLVRSRGSEKEDIEKEVKSTNVKSKQMENQLLERATSLDRKDENPQVKNLPSEKRAESCWQIYEHLNEREENVTQLEAEKQMSLNVLVRWPKELQSA